MNFTSKFRRPKSGRLILVLALLTLLARPLRAQPPPPAGDGTAPGESPPAHPETPPVHEQPPAVHEQPPAVHEQPPAVHEQPPAVHEQPPTHQQSPPDHHQQPPVQPSDHQQQPPVHEQAPVHQQPPADHQPPVQPSDLHFQPPVQPADHHQQPSDHHQQWQQPSDRHQAPIESHESPGEAGPAGQKRVPSVLLPSDPNEFDTRSISFVFLLPSRGKQCFYHKAMGNFTFEYQVTNGGSLDIDVFINSPGGKLAFDRRGKAYGETTFAHDAGKQEREQHLPAYMICLDNRYSSWHDKLVYFNLDIEQGRDGRRQGEQLSADLRASLKELELSWEEFYKSTDKIEDHLIRTMYHLTKSRNSESRDRMMMEDSGSRVNTWSIFQLVVMLFVAGIQVMMIRSLFDDKSKLHRVWKAAK